MAQPYIGEIRMFAGSFAPAGWAFCNGSLLAISEYETLFNLIGTTYGGDGQETFALPNLLGRVPLHFGNGFILAESGGAESVTLTTQQLPAHAHAMLAAAGAPNAASPQGAVLARPTASIYNGAGATVNMAPASIGSQGGTQPHDNFQPYLCLSFIISLFGIFPSQT